MKKLVFILVAALGIHVTAFGQSLKEINNYSLAYFFGNGSSSSLSQSVEVDTGNNRVAIYTAVINSITKKAENFDTSISNAITSTPIYRSSYTPEHECVLHYGGEGITGYYLDRKTGKRTTVKEQLNGPFIEGHFFEYLLVSFPLARGFTKEFSVYNYSPEYPSRTSKASVVDVGDDAYTSKHFGNRTVWKVTVAFVTAKGDQQKYLYYVDKDTRRIWKVQVENANGKNYLAINSEDDYNPYKHPFDREGTLKLVTAGTAVISGQAFAKENSSEKNIHLFNVHKKQYPPMGTVVILIPYTDFFKEWFEKNKILINAGISTVLPKGASECIRSTNVSDKEGHFEFTNLMAGDYLLLSQFNYVQGVSQTNVTGYTDTYIGGAFQYSNANTSTRYFNMLFTASVKKVVTVKQDGEKVIMTLKQI